MKVKVRTVGNTNILTIPKAFNVTPGIEFEVEQQSDGMIVFKPRHRNPFEGNWFNTDLKQIDITLERAELGHEWH